MTELSSGDHVWHPQSSSTRPLWRFFCRPLAPQSNVAANGETDLRGPIISVSRRTRERAPPAPRSSELFRLSLTTTVQPMNVSLPRWLRVMLAAGGTGGVGWSLSLFMLLQNHSHAAFSCNPSRLSFMIKLHACGSHYRRRLSRKSRSTASVFAECWAPTL